MKHHMGIDVGTTNIKAAVFNEIGDMLVYATVPTPIAHPKEGLSEFEPEQIWRAVCDSVKAILRSIRANEIGTVGISSMAEVGVPLDRLGKPLYNFIAWYDMRSQSQCEDLLGVMGKSRIYQITGQTASAKYGLTKLLWIKESHPDVYARANSWLSMEDYILYRLTGEFATDYSIASRTMAFDIHKLDWSHEILERAGIDTRLFPKAYPGGTAIGNVTREASSFCGLSETTLVSTGGHDHACAAISIDILEDGVVLDSMGTGEVSMVAISHPKVTELSQRNYYSIYPHCGKRLYRVLTSNQSCGLTLEWFLKIFCPDMLLRETREGISRFDQLFLEMRVEPDRREGLFFLPMIRGTVEQFGMYGGFYGIKDSHDRGDFIAAVVDGILYEVKRQVESYGSVFGEIYNKVRVVGGVSKSTIMMQRKADVQNMIVRTPEITEAACFGAAILGAVGAGDLKLDETSKLYKPGREYSPNALFSPSDQARFERYIKLRALAMVANAAW